VSTVLFIENEYHTERHVTRGFRLGAARSGWDLAIVWLRDAGGKLRPADSLSDEIESHKPDLILWIMDSVLPRAECLMTGGLRDVPKVSLWFDDYRRTFAIHRHAEDHRRLAAESSLRTCMWDGYWREKFREEFGIASQPIQLAADEIDYFPAEPTHFKGFDDSLIFVGNIPSRHYVYREAALFPQPCQDLIRRTGEIIGRSAYGRLPYDVLQEVYDSLSPKMKTVVDHFRSDLARNILVNRLVWMLGKREVRLRILRLAAMQRQVVILSGHSDKSFARGAELARDMEGCKHPLKFISTDHVGLHQLGSLYHIGGLHLQATDPQSVRGGIPLRVFETAASGRPLLSDFKPELAGSFAPELEIFCFQNDKDFPDRLAAVLADPARQREVAAASYQRFLHEHTWRHRFQGLVSPPSASAERRPPRVGG